MNKLLVPMALIASLSFFACDNSSSASSDSDNEISSSSVEESSSNSTEEISSSADKTEETSSSSVEKDTSSNTEDKVSSDSNNNEEKSSSSVENGSSSSIEGEEEKLPDTPWNYMNKEIKYGEIKDSRDGRTYRTVVIGDQTWMAENLNFQTDRKNQLSYCYLKKGKRDAECELYGRLYTWAAAMDSMASFSEQGKDCGYKSECKATGNVRGVCPEGFHLPTLEEFNTLIKTVGGAEKGGSNLATKTGWGDEEGNGTDAFGFSALPSGECVGAVGNSAACANQGNLTSFWSATYVDCSGTNGENECAYELSVDGANFPLEYPIPYQSRSFAKAIRCVKD